MTTSTLVMVFNVPDGVFPNPSLPRGWRAPSRATITKTKEPDLTVVGRTKPPFAFGSLIL